MIERDLDWAERLEHRVVRQAIAEAPPDDVWNVVADHPRWPQWFPALTAVIPLGPDVGGAGGRRQARSGPVRLDERFLVWDPPRRFAFTGTRVTSSALESIVEDIRLEGIDDGRRTRVTYAISAELPRVLRPMQRALVLLMGAVLGRGVAGLAELAERGTHD